MVIRLVYENMDTAIAIAKFFNDLRISGHPLLEKSDTSRFEAHAILMAQMTSNKQLALPFIDLFPVESMVNAYEMGARALNEKKAFQDIEIRERYITLLEDLKRHIVVKTVGSNEP